MSTAEKVRFLCIDDEAGSVSRLANTLNRYNITIEVKPPKAFDAQVAEVASMAIDNKIDGALLDLRLDDRKNSSVDVHYSAPALAQQLRQLQANVDTRVPEFPIVLWSVEEKISHSYSPDTTSHDLFDLVCSKEEVVEDAPGLARKLYSVGAAYKKIADARVRKCDLKYLLGVPEGIELDPRLTTATSLAPRAPLYEVARFLKRKLVSRPGPLIDENTVLARLGVDGESPDKVGLLSKLTAVCGYKGPFYEGWSRWWSHGVDQVWLSIAPDKRRLSKILPAERVSSLSSYFGLHGLVPSRVIDDTYSPYVAVACDCTGRAIDPIDGFIVADELREPWHARRYVSRQVASNPAQFNFRSQLEPHEQQRLAALMGASDD